MVDRRSTLQTGMLRYCEDHFVDDPELEHSAAHGDVVRYGRSALTDGNMGLGVLSSLNLAEDKIQRNRSSLGRVLHRTSHQVREWN